MGTVYKVFYLIISYTLVYVLFNIHMFRRRRISRKTVTFIACARFYERSDRFRSLLIRRLYMKQIICLNHSIIFLFIGSSSTSKFHSMYLFFGSYWFIYQEWYSNSNGTMFIWQSCSRNYRLIDDRSYINYASPKRNRWIWLPCCNYEKQTNYLYAQCTKFTT